MPAVSKAQRAAAAIAEHAPDKLYARNRGLLKMSHQQKHSFAATPEKGLPSHATRLAQARLSRKKSAPGHQRSVAAMKSGKTMKMPMGRG
jgi:hypothetical protein